VEDPHACAVGPWTVLLRFVVREKMVRRRFCSVSPCGDGSRLALSVRPLVPNRARRHGHHHQAGSAATICPRFVGLELYACDSPLVISILASTCLGARILGVGDVLRAARRASAPPAILLLALISSLSLSAPRSASSCPPWTLRSTSSP
jgi:hypothetical protein